MAETTLFDKFNQAKNESPENVLRILYEIFKTVHKYDKVEIISLWQAYKSVMIDDSEAANQFEVAMLTRMIGILSEHKSKVDSYESNSSIYAKERAMATEAMNGFINQIEMVTKYSIDREHLKFKKSFFKV